MSAHIICCHNHCGSPETVFQALCTLTGSRKDRFSGWSFVSTALVNRNRNCVGECYRPPAEFAHFKQCSANKMVFPFPSASTSKCVQAILPL